MKKNQKICCFFTTKSRFFPLFVLGLFLFTYSCSAKVENCRISPDYENIGESAQENQENLSKTEWKSALMSCNF